MFGVGCLQLGVVMHEQGCVIWVLCSGQWIGVRGVVLWVCGR